MHHTGTEAIMYEIGELIHYGSTGVCRVEDIKSRKFPGEKKGQLYYILKPLYQTCTISTPVDNKKVFMRPVISRDEAERLIDSIPTVKAEAYHSRVLRELAEHYEEAFASHSCEDLIQLTMSIYAKKQSMEQQKRKFGAVDERFMKRAEDLLFGELAAALDIPRDDVQDYIRQRVGDIY